jgi:hypothetical protein
VKSPRRRFPAKAGGREGRRTESQMWRHNYEVAQSGHTPGGNGRLVQHQKSQRPQRGPGAVSNRPQGSSFDDRPLVCWGLAPGGTSAPSGRGCPSALDLAAGILTGDPSAGTEILEGRPEREQLDGLSDSEVLRKSARQLCISTILVCNKFQECGSTLIAENPAEAAVLLRALCGALPAAVAAFGEALKSREHPRPQDNDGTTSNDPMQDLLKRLEAAAKK